MPHLSAVWGGWLPAGLHIWHSLCPLGQPQPVGQDDSSRICAQPKAGPVKCSGNPFAASQLTPSCISIWISPELCACWYCYCCHWWPSPKMTTASARTPPASRPASSPRRPPIRSSRARTLTSSTWCPAVSPRRCGSFTGTAHDCPRRAWSTRRPGWLRWVVHLGLDKDNDNALTCQSVITLSRKWNLLVYSVNTKLLSHNSLTAKLPI